MCQPQHRLPERRTIQGQKEAKESDPKNAISPDSEHIVLGKLCAYLRHRAELFTSPGKGFLFSQTASPELGETLPQVRFELPHIFGGEPRLAGQLTPPSEQSVL